MNHHCLFEQVQCQEEQWNSELPLLYITPRRFLALYMPGIDLGASRYDNKTSRVWWSIIENSLDFLEFHLLLTRMKLILLYLVMNNYLIYSCSLFGKDCSLTNRAKVIVTLALFILKQNYLSLYFFESSLLELYCARANSISSQTWLRNNVHFTLMQNVHDVHLDRDSVPRVRDFSRENSIPTEV